MSGRRVAVKREVPTDPKYGGRILARFMNYAMENGEKAVAEHIVYDALDKVKERGKTDPLGTFKKVLGVIALLVETKSRHVDGATYQVLVEVCPSRCDALAVRRLVNFARKRGERSMAPRLAGELLDAAEGKDAAVKKREDVYCMAEVNKVFPHYRF